MRKNKGFTLIELLVVISIIGLLSTIVLASLQQARSKGRNSSRRQTLVSMRTALELYYSANNAYPLTNGLWYSSEPGEATYNASWVPNLVGNGIAALPRDPQGGVTTHPAPCTATNRRAYWYRSTNGSGYKLLSHCAPEGSWNNTYPFYDVARPTTAWMICRPGNIPPPNDDCSI
jgi:prepilin-type N-terminal cleavage/methylation domain-containing protein